jgi:putative restriction endonuclease
MRFFVAVTDNDWFALHASRNYVQEVNFSRPSPEAGFKALQPGELLLFKLHAPMNFIAGGGFFVRFHQQPVNLVWETFGEANGVQSLEEMRQRIAYYRRRPIIPHENPNIGSIMLADSKRCPTMCSALVPSAGERVCGRGRIEEHRGQSEMVMREKNQLSL